MRKNENFLLIGYTLRRLIAEGATSQAEMCDALGWASSSLSCLANGKVAMPTFDRAAEMADYFGITLDELWERILSDSATQGYAKFRARAEKAYWGR